MFGYWKIKGTMGGVKIEKKIQGKKKLRKIKKNLKLINYFYMLLHTHFIYFNLSMQRLNNLKMHKFINNFNCICFSFLFSLVRKSFS